MRAVRFAWLILAWLVSIQTAGASGTLEVGSNLPARVYLDGEFVGNSPLVLEEVAGGEHTLRLEETVSNHAQVFPLLIPSRATVTRRLRANFHGDDPPLVVVGATAGTAPKAQARAHARSPHADSRTRSRVRMRNVGLGVGALGVLTGKSTLTGIGLGTALVNEVVNR